MTAQPHHERSRSPLPHANGEPRVREESASSRAVFAKGLCFGKLVWVFTAGCFLGYVVEMLFCAVVHGYVENRQGMIFGPFSQIYGFGAVIMTLALHPISPRSNALTFAAGALMGSLFEFICSLVQETIFHSRSWNFSGQPLNINGRTSLDFALMWGVLGFLFIKFAYPWLSKWIERIPRVVGAMVTWLLVFFFAANLLLSGAAVLRWSERQRDLPASCALSSYLDKQYPDGAMTKIYPQIRFVNR